MLKKRRKYLVKDYNLRYQESSVAQRYHEGYSKRLSSKNYRIKIIGELEKRILDSILKKELEDIRSLLDFPCGGGKLASILQGKGFSFFAADISNAMLTIARKSYLPASNFCGVIQADATQMSFKSESFDCVICLRLMHRIPPEIRQKVLLELARVTRKYIVISYGITMVTDRFRRFLMKQNPKAPYYLATKKDVFLEITASHLKIRRAYDVIPYLYYERIFLLEK